MTTNPSPDQAQHTAASAKAILEGKYPSEFLGRCAQCLDNTHLDGTCNFGLKQDCLLHKAQEYERRQAQKFLDSLPSTGETARSEDVAVPREALRKRLCAHAQKWSGIFTHHPGWKDQVLIDDLRAASAALAAAPQEGIAVPRKWLEELAYFRVRDIRGSDDVPGFGSCVKSELNKMLQSLAAAPRPDAIADVCDRALRRSAEFQYEITTPTVDVAAKLAEMVPAMSRCAAWAEEIELPTWVPDSFRAARDTITTLTERAAALERENERLRKFLADVVRIVRAYSGNALEHRLDEWSASPPIRRALGENR